MSRPLEDTAKYSETEEFAAKFFVPSWEKVDVNCGGATHPGKVRENNEDHFAVAHRSRSQRLLLSNLPDKDLPAFHQDAHILIVADGIGGAVAGELASQLVIEELWKLSAQASSWVMKVHGLSEQQIRERSEAYANRMHVKLMRAGDENPKLRGMGTTFTSAYLVGWDAIFSHIGDSRAYICRRGKLHQLTQDHTLAQEMIDHGASKEDTTHLRHIITNSLGGRHGEGHPDVVHVVLQDGDRLLLCTDGLSDLVDSLTIAEILSAKTPPQAACDALVEQALANGGHDNITAVLADVIARGE